MVGYYQRVKIFNKDSDEVINKWIAEMEEKHISFKIINVSSSVCALEYYSTSQIVITYTIKR